MVRSFTYRPHEEQDSTSRACVMNSYYTIRHARILSRNLQLTRTATFSIQAVSPRLKVKHHPQLANRSEKPSEPNHTLTKGKSCQAKCFMPVVSMPNRNGLINGACHDIVPKDACRKTRASKKKVGKTLDEGRHSWRVRPMPRRLRRPPQISTSRRPRLSAVPSV